MNIALIAMHYPPMRTSGAVQLRDLAKEFVRQEHELVVFTPDSAINVPYLMEIVDGVTVIRIAAPRIIDASYIRLGIGEFILPFALMLGIQRCPYKLIRGDCIVWSSPSIFLGLLVGVLKRRFRLRSYLILRDVFPDMIVDLGVIRRGLIYRIFKLVERYQYSVADCIGVQSYSDLYYLENWGRKPGRSLEVLQNWLSPTPNIGSSIVVENTCLSRRTIFVYTGNIGVAQDLDIFIDVAERLNYRTDIGFLFVGRGGQFDRISRSASKRNLTNVLFHAEVDPSEIPGLLAQCHIGIVALDHRHKTHNIPGKFLTYVQYGIPVLARINSGNELANLIENEGVGRAYVGESAEELRVIAEEFVSDQSGRCVMAARGPALARKLFSPSIAVSKIASALGGIA